MEWDFTPEDVINGRAAYGLENFRADLASEVRMNLGSAHEEEIRREAEEKHARFRLAHQS